MSVHRTSIKDFLCLAIYITAIRSTFKIRFLQPLLELTSEEKCYISEDLIFNYALTTAWNKARRQVAVVLLRWCSYFELSISRACTSTLQFHNAYKFITLTDARHSHTVAWVILLLKYIYGYISASYLNFYCLNEEAHFECDSQIVHPKTRWTMMEVLT